MRVFRYTGVMYAGIQVSVAVAQSHHMNITHSIFQDVLSFPVVRRIRRSDVLAGQWAGSCMT